MKHSKNKTQNPDHSPNINRVRRVKGQVEGIEKMIRDGKYCPDIITQIRAATAALKSLQANILETHFKHCVHHAFSSKDAKDKDQKISELIELFKKN